MTICVAQSYAVSPIILTFCCPSVGTFGTCTTSHLLRSALSAKQPFKPPSRMAGNTINQKKSCLKVCVHLYMCTITRTHDICRKRNNFGGHESWWYTEKPYVNGGCLSIRGTSATFVKEDFLSLSGLSIYQLFSKVKYSKLWPENSCFLFQITTFLVQNRQRAVQEVTSQALITSWQRCHLKQMWLRNIQLRGEVLAWPVGLQGMNIYS